VIWVVVVILAVALVVVVALARRRNRPVDGVAQFKRQIDALSPEARRPVVDQVAQLDEEAAAPSETPATEAPADPPGDTKPGDADGPPEDPDRGP
jgi:hypothetical protein